LVLFLSLSPSVAASRGGYGLERYETDTIQNKVRSVFGRIEEDFKGRNGRWKEIDAGKSVEQVGEEIWREVELVRKKARDEIGKLWQ
jgi:dTMP kinase